MSSSPEGRRRTALLITGVLVVLAGAVLAQHGGDAGAASPVRTTTVRYGPFPLAPGVGPVHGHTSLVLPAVAKPCDDCFITGLRPDLVDDQGRSVNLDTGPMLHHAVWIQSGRRDATCGPETTLGKAGQRFFASGNERTAGDLPDGFGYWVGREPWSMIVELMNHGDRPQTVYVALRVTWQPAAEPLRPVTPVWLDIDNCGDSVYGVPAGPAHDVFRWPSTLTGRVLTAGGHLHDGGVRTVLRNETTGQAMCTSVAGYGTKPAYRGTIESMSVCSHDRLGTVRKGEVLGLHAFYDSPEARHDVMGIDLAYVYETDQLDGGTPYRAPRSAPEPGPPTSASTSGGHRH